MFARKIIELNAHSDYNEVSFLESISTDSSRIAIVAGAGDADRVRFGDEHS